MIADGSSNQASRLGWGAAGEQKISLVPYSNEPKTRTAKWFQQEFGPLSPVYPTPGAWMETSSGSKTGLHYRAIGTV